VPVSSEYGQNVPKKNTDVDQNVNLNVVEIKINAEKNAEKPEGAHR